MLLTLPLSAGIAFACTSPNENHSAPNDTPPASDATAIPPSVSWPRRMTAPSLIFSNSPRIIPRCSRAATACTPKTSNTRFWQKVSTIWPRTSSKSPLDPNEKPA